jgi:hypothetical protein
MRGFGVGCGCVTSFQFHAWSMTVARTQVSNPAVAKRADDEISMRRQLRSWFDFLDKDGSGEIDIHELEDPLTCMGCGAPGERAVQGGEQYSARRCACAA